MTAFAEDLSTHLKSSQPNNTTVESNISIDIGLTTEPYYTDKSVAIAESDPPFYTSRPNHVHLVGYDTLIRFCNPKYYPKFSPPLSALAPFFEAGHGLRVTLRPCDTSDNSSKEFGSVEDQKRYVQRLKDGEMEKDGFLKQWGEEAIEVEEGAEGVGISSTRVRNAAKEGNWDVVGELCTEGVAAWIKEAKLYGEDASGKKMTG